MLWRITPRCSCLEVAESLLYPVSLAGWSITGPPGTHFLGHIWLSSSGLLDAEVHFCSLLHGDSFYRNSPFGKWIITKITNTFLFSKGFCVFITYSQQAFVAGQAGINNLISKERKLKLRKVSYPVNGRCETWVQAFCGFVDCTVPEPTLYYAVSLEPWL